MLTLTRQKAHYFTIYLFYRYLEAVVGEEAAELIVGRVIV